MMGPHEGSFSDAARRAFVSERFEVTPESNRMGYRLDGPRLEYVRPIDMLSDATPLGSLQVPPSGWPILLMADRQTTGGYPKIATVITADLPIAGQLAPGLEGSVVMVAAARDTQVGLVRRLLSQACQRAATWMGVAA